MLASTERSSEIERQRRSQLQRVDRFRYSRPSLPGRCAEASAGFCRPRSSEVFEERRTPITSTVLTPDAGQSTLTGLTDVRQQTRNDSTNSAYSDAPCNDNWKSKNGNKPAKRVRVRHHNSVISDSAASTKCVPDVVAELRAAPLSYDAPERQASYTELKSQTVDGHSRFPTRRWSSLKELSDRTASSQSPSVGADQRSSSDRRGISDRRTSRLDRRVYQCYFAGILHSSRRSERFLRLQQLYAVLENAVEMETEMLSLRQRTTPSTTHHGGCQLLDSSDATDPSSRKRWHQRSLELRKLYAKLDAAQDDKEFFYDNGRLNTFQWKSWRDLGLSKKSSSLTKLKDLFEAAVVDSRSAITTKTSQIQRVERGLSYGKLLETFRRLEKRTRTEAEAWLRWQSTSQHSVASVRKLDGTYMKMMESAARNAKALALHGYHMNEHRNRYDAYVQSRRIFRPTSAPNVFEQPSSDEQPDMDEVASSDRTMSSTSGYDNSFYCNERYSDEPTAHPASSLTDSSQILSPVTSAGSATDCSASVQLADTCAEARCASEKEIVSVEVAAVAKQSLSEGVDCDEKLTQRQFATDDDPDTIVDELDAAAVKLGSRSKQKSRKRERQRPRCRNGNGAMQNRTDVLNAVSGSAARRHIEAWRRSSRPLSGTLNQALAYFNSLCIDDSNDKNSQSTVCESKVDSAVSQNEDGETRDQINSAEISNQLMSAFPSSTENEVEQLAERGKKFSTEIQLDVKSGESVAESDRGKLVLPRLYSCRDEVVVAEFPTSNVSSRSLATCHRAVNIDKRRSRYEVDTMESNSQRRGYSAANAKETEAKIAGVQSTTSQSDVTTTPEVHPTYVRSEPVVRMLSESQSIQTTSVSSPMFVDCRKAGVRKLPTLIGPGCLPAADHLSTYNDWIVSTASNPVSCTDAISSEKLLCSDWSSADKEARQIANKRRCLKEASKIAVTSAVSATQRENLPEDSSLRAKNNVTYVSAIDSSSFICRRCCRSLATCRCASAAETGARCRVEDRRDFVDHGDLCRLNDDRKSMSLKSADSLTPNASRSAGDLHHQPATGTVCPSYRRLRPVAGNSLGEQEAEMRRMMASLEMIDSEWMNCRPGRSSQPVHLASDNNNNSPSRLWKCGSSVDERQLTSGYLDQHARQVPVTASVTSNGDPLSQHCARMLNGNRGFGNKCETFSNGGDTALVNDRTDHDTNVSNNKSRFQVTGSTNNGQNNTVQRELVNVCRRLRAIYSYSPRHADELELNKDDIIYLAEVCDDGWFLGTSERTKQFGTFPGNYVRPVT